MMHYPRIEPAPEDKGMEDAFIVYMDEDPLSFTNDGSVSVLDAIGMLMDTGSAAAVWERMKTEHPEVLDHCREHAFEDQGTVTVTSKDGWEIIWMILAGYFFDMSLDRG
jgi:hypothetical protein